MTQQTVLFLCTGNYYRSRFAEILFNDLAPAFCPEYIADSRGLLEDLSLNPGPISAHTLAGLKERGIAPSADLRYPLSLQVTELEQAACIIALYETEHRPLLQQRFPAWTERVEYWYVPDLEEMSSSIALAEIERLVRCLLERLATAPKLL